MANDDRSFAHVIVPEVCRTQRLRPSATHPVPNYRVKTRSMKVVLMQGRRDHILRLRQASWVARFVGAPDAVPWSKTDVAALATSLELRRFSPGEIVFKSGGVPEGVYIVKQGRIQLRARSSGRSRIIRVLREADMDGDTQLLLGQVLAYDGRCTAAAEVIFLPAHAFEQLIAAHPRIAQRWLYSVSGRMIEGNGRIFSLLGQGARQKTARLLLDEAEGDIVCLPQVTMASMLGMTRPSLNRALAALEQHGVVEKRYGVVSILDRDLLTQFA